MPYVLSMSYDYYEFYEVFDWPSPSFHFNIQMNEGCLQIRYSGGQNIGR